MATPDKYTVEVRCPQCMQEGVLYISEGDYSFARHRNIEIVDIDGKFLAYIGDKNQFITTCKLCSTVSS